MSSCLAHVVGAGKARQGRKEKVPYSHSLLGTPPRAKSTSGNACFAPTSAQPQPIVSVSNSNPTAGHQLRPDRPVNTPPVPCHALLWLSYTGPDLTEKILLRTSAVPRKRGVCASISKSVPSPPPPPSSPLPSFHRRSAPFSPAWAHVPGHWMCGSEPCFYPSS